MMLAEDSGHWKTLVNVAFGPLDYISHRFS
jgi:hypothetical protein